MDADSLAENTPNAPEFVCPSPKVLDFNEKKAKFAVCSPCPDRFIQANKVQFHRQTNFQNAFFSFYYSWGHQTSKMTPSSKAQRVKGDAITA